MVPDWRQLLGRLKAKRPVADSVEGNRSSSSAVPLTVEETSPASPRPTSQKSAQQPVAAGRTAPDALGQRAGQPSSGSSARSSINRNGIPVLGPGDDLDRIMQDREAAATPEDARMSDLPPTTVREYGSRKMRTRSSSGGSAGRGQINRHGLPVLSGDDDLQKRFRTAGADNPSSPERAVAPTNRSDDCERTDKNGIPVLDYCQDLGRLFEAAPEKSRPDADLADAFQQSIAHDTRTLIKKKTGGYFPARTLTLKERLKRYPQPQGQLDLHGAKALQAQQRADSFIRTAQADGLFTLRIIVGKGLHSESGAVLPDVVEDRLIQLKRDGLVLAYRWEKGLKRKSGAVIVYLESSF